MGFLDRLFGRKGTSTEVDMSQIKEDCPHSTLGPHWDRAEDFGKHEAISSYVCEGCGISFTPEEAARVSSSIADSVRERVEVDESMRKTVEEEAADAEKDFKYLG
jgi:hypothetical protein